MADKKISALTAASTPLAGTEVLPIVQGGSTVKVSISDVTAGRAVVASSYQVGTRLKINSTHIADAPAPTGNDTGLAFSSRIYPCDSAGNLTNNTLSLGSSLYRFSSIHIGDNLVIGTAGKGIDFSANTHAAGMTSELLNWYEEGTWTGTLTGFGAAPTTPVTTTGRYTRIGRTVTIQIVFNGVNTTGASGVLLVTGLPFTNSAQVAAGACYLGGMGAVTAAAYIQASDNRISFINASTAAYVDIVAGSGKYVGLAVTYTV